MALVYLSTHPDGRLEPEWVAYACHDFSGDDLRRRWDDGEGLIRVGDHPVIFAGGGSHASYFKPRRVHPADRAADHEVAQAGRRGLEPLLERDPAPGFGRARKSQRVHGALRRLCPRRRPVDRARSGEGMDAGQPRPGPRLGHQVSRAVGPVHRRPAGGRGRTRRPDVQPRRYGPPGVVRPVRVRRPRQGRSADRGPAASRTTAHRAGRGQRRPRARDRHEDGRASACRTRSWPRSRATRTSNASTTRCRPG